MSKKSKLPGFKLTPAEAAPVETEQQALESYYDVAVPVTTKANADTTEELTPIMHETMTAIYNPKTKTYDKVSIRFSLDGKLIIDNIQKGHSNPLVIQQELSKYFLEKLVTKRKR